MFLSLPVTGRNQRRLVMPVAGVVGILVIALLAPLLAPHDPVRMDIAHRLAHPTPAHWLGQDEYGRDVLSRLIWGARVSLTVAIVAALISGAAGVTIGLVGGYVRGIAELFTVRLTDVVLSFPPILLGLLVVTVLGPGAKTLTLVLSILYIPGYARVTYGEVLSAREVEYVEAARAAGARPGRILFRTILPNVAGPILVQFSLTVASAIVVESGLSFLGLGVVPPAPSWGLMIRSARSTMEQSWLLLLWPCLALVAAILAVNALCDALRDVVDPRAYAAHARVDSRGRTP
jgi:ABC-type dipeptide/oligopeptide/nickel transport system permease subunit